MSRLLLIVASIIALTACREQNNTTEQLKAQINELQTQLNNSYKPGFGELMSNIQVHHNKLYFAGKNLNWQLAEFEIHEIIESLDNIETYCSERPETKSINTIKPSLDSLNVAIKEKNNALFEQYFSSLTSTCNNCHQANNFGFNVIKIPDSPPFSNQEFRANGAN